MDSFKLYYFVTLSFILGAVVGSFLNVLIYRLPRNLSIVKPGSFCPSCKTPIPFYLNIPIISYLLLRGRCKFCGAKISSRYFFVELLTAVLSVATFLRLSSLSSPNTPLWVLGVEFVLYFYFVSSLVAITFIDIDTMTIPNELSIPGIFIGIAGAYFVSKFSMTKLPDSIFSLSIFGIGATSSFLGVVIGAGFLLLLAIIFKIVRKKEGLGMGDVKLSAMIFAFLGYQSISFVFLAASLQGLIFTAIFFKKVRKQGFMIPFGPFLSLAALEWFLFSDKIIKLFVKLVFDVA